MFSAPTLTYRPATDMRAQPVPPHAPLDGNAATFNGARCDVQGLVRPFDEGGQPRSYHALGHGRILCFSVRTTEDSDAAAL
jgi:hypothetical protein